MNFTLTTKASSLYGIISDFVSDDQSMKLVTLEHAYPVDATFVPKLARGKTYTCIKGIHRLSHGGPITAFEVMDVPVFQGKPVTGLLCGHNGDSEGCVLLGSILGTGCILESSVAFHEFMGLQSNVEQYTLKVV
jgi:hypothetical protein